MHDTLRSSSLWQLVLRRMDGIEPVFADDLSRYMVGVGDSLNLYFSASHIGPEGTPWMQVVAPLTEMSVTNPPSQDTMKALLALGLAVAQRYSEFALGVDGPLNAAVLIWEHPVTLSGSDTERLFDDFLDAVSVTRTLVENAEASSFSSNRSSSRGMGGRYGDGPALNASLLSILEQAPKA